MPRFAELSMKKADCLPRRQACAVGDHLVVKRADPRMVSPSNHNFKDAPDLMLGFPCMNARGTQITSADRHLF